MPGTLGLQHNFGIVVHTGRNLGERPDPKLKPLGDRFTNESTSEEYVVVRDASGNHVWIQVGVSTGTGAVPRLYKFSGQLIGGNAPFEGWLPDTTPAGAIPTPITSIGYPVLASGKIDKTRIRMTVLSNSLSEACQAAVAVNGVDTAAVVTIGAGSTVVPAFPADVNVVAGDVVDFHLIGTVTATGSLQCSAAFDIVNP